MILCPCKPRVNNIMREMQIKAVVECYLLCLEATHSVSEWKINVIRCEVSCIFVICVFYVMLWSRVLRQGKNCDNFLFICHCYVCVNSVIITQHLIICGMYVMETLFTLRAFMSLLCDL